MDKTLNRLGIDRIQDAVNNSNSYVDVTLFLGLELSSRKNVERTIKRLGISCDHFKTVKRLKGSKNRFNEEKLKILVEKFIEYKEILEELKIENTVDNLNKLKTYLYRHNIDYSHLKYNRRLIKSDIWNKEILAEIVKESKTQTEVLQKIKIRSAGGNYYTLQKYIKLYDLDTSHFIKSYSIMINSNTIPLNKILIEKSTYNNGTNIKKKLFKEGLKTKYCELCGQGEEWNGKHMSLILDHKNGVHDDNRIENLRIVCPNCNATLDTHAGKNIKKVAH